MQHTISVYYSFRELVDDIKPDALDGLTDDEVDYISCCDDYSGMRYTVVGNTVFTSEGLPGTIVSVDNINKFIGYNLECIIADLRGEEKI